MIASSLLPIAMLSFLKIRNHIVCCGKGPPGTGKTQTILGLLSAILHATPSRMLSNFGAVAIAVSFIPVIFSLSVEQKRNGSTADKQKLGGTGKDKDSIRSAILDEAVIVCSTLSFSGSSLLGKLNHGFDIIKPATLAPLVTGCKQVFLVGDPAQLPATVISKVAKRFGYDTSLFKRLQRAGYLVKMLKIQYRMHPQIRSFPSKDFYDEALEDGSGVEDYTTRDWHKYGCFGPFCFFDIEGVEESRTNKNEVEFVLLLYHKLVNMYPELKSSSQIAIMSPYSGQVKEFQERFKKNFGAESQKVVDITTVDGCQGREKDVVIILLSCVRANQAKGIGLANQDKGGIGFLKDNRRMNVAITRAKSSVLGLHQNCGMETSIGETSSKVLRIEDVFLRCLSHMTRFSSLKVKAEEAQAAERDDPRDNENMAVYVNTGDADDNEYGRWGLSGSQLCRCRR
ncbi:hypothetical protein JRO89_XS07G0104600 [Xanthoceras sorbifolium]|uniref:Helicase MAGATAMA 3 n=1 Tax=Xanthoceras sorbifolium TaxID=99658 RepID=A0ABQ8HTJ5_9ROSI|nr:hypothetical protein JRO89_XS07G0104600 [Xanthoceras sorbifolium]